MADDSKKLSITYSSGLIPPPELMSTLTVFYDEIWLPNPYDIDVFPIVSIGITLDDKGFGELQHQYFEECIQWSTFLEQDILRILPPLNLANTDVQRFIQYCKKKSKLNPRTNTAIIPILVCHTQAYKPSPELFTSVPSDTRTSRLAGFITQSIFEYMVPRLNELSGEQILEVRDYPKDTKEGE